MHIRNHALLTAIMLLITTLPALAQSWATPADISNTSNLWEAGQSFTVDSRGKTHITYVSWNDSTTGTIYYTNDDTSDGRFTTPTAVPIPGYWLYDHTTHLTHTSDDTLHLSVSVKINGGTGAENVIYLNKPRGGSWSAPVLLTSDTTEFTRSHGIVALPDGSIFVLMVDDNDGYGRLLNRMRSPSGVWGPEETLYTSSINGRYPAGWCGVSGAELYVGYDQPFTSGAFYQVKRSGVWSGWKQVGFYNAQTGSRVTISRSPLTGELAAVYGYDTGDGGSYGSGNLNFDIYARFSTDNGSTWGPQVRVSPGNSLDRGATCVYDSSGNLHVVWYGQVTAGDYGSALYRMRTPDGTWKPQVNISNNPGRTGTGFQAIQLSGCTLHIVYANSGWPSSGAGYEDIWHATMDLPCDSTPPASVTGFSAAAGEQRVVLNWTNPNDSDFSATCIRMSTSGYPATPSDGTLAAYRYARPGTSDTVTLWPLTAGLTYYFSAFAVDSSGSPSTAVHATAVPTADVSAPAEVTGFTAVSYGSQSLALSWTNPQDIDFKGTLIRYRMDTYPTNPNDGTQACNLQATPGSAGSYNHPNLALGKTFYYTAFTYDTNGHYSVGAHARGVSQSQTCLAVKQLTDGDPVDLKSKTITAIFPSDACVYIAEQDRSSGIRVAYTTLPSPLAVGDTVNVTGAAGSRLLNGVLAERQVSSGVITRLSSGSASPVGMTCLSIGGGAVGSVPGVVSGFGLNNEGLLVRIAGKITNIKSSYIYVDDGSRVPNISGTSTPEIGVMVKCPGTLTGYAIGNMVSITGIIQGSVPSGWTSNRRYIVIRDWNDIKLFPQTTP